MGNVTGPTIFKRKKDVGKLPKPRAVSIGPYHRNSEYPLTFDDDYKWKITRFLVNYWGLDVEEYLKRMEEEEVFVRSCYDRELAIWSSEEFRTMLLLDSSFILLVTDRFSLLEPDGFYTEYMALYIDVREHSKQIKLDLLTIDNQIPFFAIEILKSCFPGDSNLFMPSIKVLALLHFDDIWPMRNEKRVLADWDGAHFHHLLHLFHWSRMPKEGYEMDCSYRAGKYYASQYIPSATELQKFATKFARKVSGSYLHITFKHGLMNIFGVINIPTLYLYDYSEAIFRNLIEFEVNTSNNVHCFTAYTACMSCILQREDDVKLLRERGILASTNYKDADVINFFMDLNKEVDDLMIPSTLLELYDNVIEHHMSPISQWSGNFPWIKFSLAGAYVLFLFTLLQTIYSMLSYHVPEKK